MGAIKEFCQNLGQEFSYKSPGALETYQDAQTRCQTLAFEYQHYQK